jgi:hypothetical protein
VFTGLTRSLLTKVRPRCVLSVMVIAVDTVVSPMVPRGSMVAIVTPSIAAAVPLHPRAVVLSLHLTTPTSAAVVVCASCVGRHGRMDQCPTTNVHVITRALVARSAEVVALLGAFK